MPSEVPQEIMDWIRELVSLPMFDVYRRLSRINDPQMIVLILQALVESIEINPDRLKNEDTDSMHNIAMVASKTPRSDLEERLLTVFSKAAPGEVDLRADLLQFYFVNKKNPIELEKQWAILNDDKVIDPVKRKLNWRYWVFGALYHARILNNVKEAQRLLEEGVKHVAGSSKSDILRNFKHVFVDHTNEPQYDIVIKELKDGIAKGWDLGYTLAYELAQLFQMRSSTDYKSVSEQNSSNEKLREALHWLDVAESLFTDNPQHSLEDIFRTRIHVLMGLKSYQQAIQYIAAFCKQNPQAAKLDKSLKGQLYLACMNLGKVDLANEIWSEIESKHNQEIPNEEE